MAGPLGHLALPGIALALVYGFDVSLGAFPFVVLGMILIWFFEMRTKLPIEALTAVVFASGVAFAFLFLPIEQAEMALVGDISRVSFWETVFVVVLSAIVFAVVSKIFSKIILINISEDIARSEKINVKWHTFFYLACVAVIVALGVKVVGSLLTAALVAIPAATARNWSESVQSYRTLSLFLGAASAIFGIIISQSWGFPAGPMIILTGTLLFIVSIIFKK